MTTRTLILLALVAAAGPQLATADPDPLAPVSGVRLDQRLGESVPLDATFFDELGHEVRLADFVDSRPVVLVPAYYRCPMLCTLVINTLVGAVADCPLGPGVDYRIVVFSIDPRERPQLAAEKKLNYLRRFGNNDTQAGWHFLTGREEQIQRVTAALGYGYVYDREHDQYAHPAAAAVLTGDGRIARYLLGVQYSGKDLKFALVEAGEGKIGSFFGQVLLRCYYYDPAAGHYGLAIMNAVRVGGLLTPLAVFGLIKLASRRRARAKLAESQP